MSIIEETSGIELQQLQSFLLDYERLSAETLLMLGHEALLERNGGILEVVLQVCFDKASNPETINPRDYSRAYCFLQYLVRDEVVIG